MEICIRTIPHKEQRYETPGDWWFNADGDLQIRVSDIGNPDYEACIAFHELFEALVATKNGISEKDISDFDKIFEENRAKGIHSEHDEPGMSSNAPYRKEHQLATGVEMILGTSLGVVWNEYDSAVTKLLKHE